MKLSKKTIDVLKNFSLLNPSVLIVPGRVQKTISVAKKTMAEVILEEDFPVKFGIYELSKFLGAYSFFKDPDISFGSSSLVIEADGRRLEYAYAAEEAIMRPPNKELVVDPDAQFPLPWSVLEEVLKAGKVMSLTELEFSGKGGTVSIRAVDARNSSSHSYKVDLGKTDKDFKVILKADAFKFLEADYQATISFTKLTQFDAPGITYKVAAEAVESR